MVFDPVENLLVVFTLLFANKLNFYAKQCDLYKTYVAVVVHFEFVKSITLRLQYIRRQGAHKILKVVQVLIVNGYYYIP